MTIRVTELTTAMPEVRAFRWACDQPYTGVKQTHSVARVVHGSSAYQAAGKRWQAGPGTVVLKQPGDVHHDATAHREIVMSVVVLPVRLVETAAAASGGGRRARVRVVPQLAANDERAAAFHRLHDAIGEGLAAERLVLEVAVAEAVAAYVAFDAPSTHSPAIRRALELLRARVVEGVTLDDLAREAGLDKFHLCHTFRTQIGIPPYAYLTQLRVARAKQLLDAGVRPRDVAPQVGFYDQSQLNRHFRRIVGTTPGAYQR